MCPHVAAKLVSHSLLGLYLRGAARLRTRRKGCFREGSVFPRLRSQDIERVLVDPGEDEEADVSKHFKLVFRPGSDGRACRLCGL